MKKARNILALIYGAKALKLDLISGPAEPKIEESCKVWPGRLGTQEATFKKVLGSGTPWKDPLFPASD